jgi:hypothetical protein
MIEIKTSPSVTAEKILKKAYELGQFRGDIMFVVPEIHVPKGTLICWCHPETFANLEKIKEAGGEG